VVTIAPEHRAAFETAMGLGNLTLLGKTVKKRHLRIINGDQTLLDVQISELKNAWLGALGAL
jgi:hypothetical protein